ncbi:Adenylate and Guanylate cyclase catalytic domain-containing protein [Geodermatophilus africanus]|uniref:Adenylate and Guanylate cyclase catalytic domain-containing protein n=1 Tax=Geodermatophilus africanus TaxID=1137993 RepID=A0A1H3AIA4_9ACTN|nr:adenylate/guanylate cyclase domain-containing protein [Geodermatophilus africanus]SDX29171.1 Adenylate and Guanylate cyclase catalytic domain-containing protein [Geodermatophilus africanus]
MTGLALPAETRLARLLERLLTGAEASLAAGDLEPARATAEEVRAVDPDNRRAARILQRVAGRQVGPAGERALMTLLFSDLVGSTLLSERVEPEQLRDLFAVYRAAAHEAVHRYGGTLMHYSGDGILAGFGHPVPHEDDARRAVLAGLDLVVALHDARARLTDRFGVALEVRVGIHTGRVVVTDLVEDGAVAERDSVVGLIPTLAARVQQTADPGTVVISDVTQQLVDADFYLQSLGERGLTGISRPVEVFRVDRPRYAAARFQSERYRKAGLVGRDEPRARLLEAWDAVRQESGSGAGAAFLVVGEPGIGKSRLVAEVIDRVEASGGRVLGAACLPYHANVSLWPIARMIERLVSRAGEGGDRLRPLVAHLESLGLDPAVVVPLIGPLAGLAPTPEYPAPELDPGAVLDETLDRLVDWMAAAAARRPHLFVAEDLHWADPSTVDLLGRIAVRRPAGLLTVATSRDDAAVPWRDAVDVLPLGRLDDRAADRLVGNLTAGRDLDAGVRSAIVDHAEGIPLFIEELTRSGLDARRSEPIPLRLQELLTWRLKAPGVDLRVVQTAATIGPTFDPATVAAAVGDADLVAEQLPVLADAGIVEPAGLATGTYRFRHALMRDAAYETQVLDVRRRTHARVAEALAARGAEPALVAQHLDLAGAADRAADRYRDAAQAEQARGAHPEATKLLSRALELLQTLPESDDRDLEELTARMLRGLSVNSVQGYASPDVEADHRRAQELAARLGRPEVLPALIALWLYWFTSGRLTTARGVLDQLTAMVREPAFASFEPEVAVLAGIHDFHRGHLVSAQAHLERAEAGFAARPAEQRVSPLWPLPDDPTAVSASVLASVSAARGELDEAERWEQEALRRAAAVGSPRGPVSLAYVNIYVALIRYFLGDDAAAARAGAAAVAIGEEHGLAFWSAIGATYAATGTPGGAPDRQFLERALAALELMGWQSFLAFHLAHLARLDAAAGEVDQAEEHLAEAFAAVFRTGEDLHLPELLRQRAALRLARGGDAGVAVADLTEAVRIATAQGARVSRLRAALDLARLPAPSRPEHWRILLAEARADMPPSFVTDETARADLLLDR